MKEPTSRYCRELIQVPLGSRRPNPIAIVTKHLRDALLELVCILPQPVEDAPLMIRPGTDINSAPLTSRRNPTKIRCQWCFPLSISLSFVLPLTFLLTEDRIVTFLRCYWLTSPCSVNSEAHSFLYCGIHCSLRKKYLRNYHSVKYIHLLIMYNNLTLQYTIYK